MAAVASWQNSAAIYACLESSSLDSIGDREDAGGEKSESWEDKVLHFERWRGISRRFEALCLEYCMI
jgi:hypothetical protein